MVYLRYRNILLILLALSSPQNLLLLYTKCICNNKEKHILFWNNTKNDVCTTLVNAAVTRSYPNSLTNAAENADDIVEYQGKMQKT